MDDLNKEYESPLRQALIKAQDVDVEAGVRFLNEQSERIRKHDSFEDQQRVQKTLDSLPATQPAPATNVCSFCDHPASDHAQGQMRRTEPCEAPDCDCGNYQARAPATDARECRSADDIALEFIQDFTKLPVDGPAHRALVRIIDKARASALSTPEPELMKPWLDESGHAWEVRPNVRCVECPHCCFIFAAEHTSQRFEADQWEGYDCPNCEGCPDVKKPTTPTNLDQRVRRAAEAITELGQASKRCCICYKSKEIAAIITAHLTEQEKQ